MGKNAQLILQSLNNLGEDVDRLHAVVDGEHKPLTKQENQVWLKVNDQPCQISRPTLTKETSMLFIYAPIGKFYVTSFPNEITIRTITKRVLELTRSSCSKFKKKFGISSVQFISLVTSLSGKFIQFI